MVFEGQEKDDFWNVLGGKEEYASEKRLQVCLKAVIFSCRHNFSDWIC